MALGSHMRLPQIPSPLFDLLAFYRNTPPNNDCRDVNCVWTSNYQLTANLNSLQSSISRE